MAALRRLHAGGALLCAAMLASVMDPVLTAIALLGALHLAFSLPALMSALAAAAVFLRLQHRHDPLNNSLQKYVANTGDAMHLALTGLLVVSAMTAAYARATADSPELRPPVSALIIMLVLGVKSMIDNQSGVELAAAALRLLSGAAEAVRGVVRAATRTTDAARSATY